MDTNNSCVPPPNHPIHPPFPPPGHTLVHGYYSPHVHPGNGVYSPSSVPDVYPGNGYYSPLSAPGVHPINPTFGQPGPSHSGKSSVIYNDEVRRFLEQNAQRSSDRTPSGERHRRRRSSREDKEKDRDHDRGRNRSKGVEKEHKSSMESGRNRVRSGEKEREGRRIKEKEREGGRIKEKEREDGRIKEKEREIARSYEKETKGEKRKENSKGRNSSSKEEPKSCDNDINPKKEMYLICPCGCPEYTEPDLIQHVEQCHSEFLFKCINKYKSKTCERVFWKLSDLRPHLERNIISHGNMLEWGNDRLALDNRILYPVDLKEFRCKVCRKNKSHFCSFLREVAINHVRNIHRIDTNPEQHIKYKCRECGQDHFSDENYLQVHIDEEHKKALDFSNLTRNPAPIKEDIDSDIEVLEVIPVIRPNLNGSNIEIPNTFTPDHLGSQGAIREASYLDFRPSHDNDNRPYAFETSRSDMEESLLERRSQKSFDPHPDSSNHHTHDYDESQWPCNFCEETISESDESAHLKTHYDCLFKCAECKAGFIKYSIAQEHVESSHERDSFILQPESKFMIVFKCGVVGCGRKFIGPAGMMNLNRHLKNNHEKHEHNPLSLCRICEDREIFDSLEKLADHIRKRHPNQNVAPPSPDSSSNEETVVREAEDLDEEFSLDYSVEKKNRKLTIPSPKDLANKQSHKRFRGEKNGESRSKSNPQPSSEENTKKYKHSKEIDSSSSSSSEETSGSYSSEKRKNKKAKTASSSSKMQKINTDDILENLVEHQLKSQSSRITSESDSTGSSTSTSENGYKYKLRNRKKAKKVTTSRKRKQAESSSSSDTDSDHGEINRKSSPKKKRKLKNCSDKSNLIKKKKIKLLEEPVENWKLNQNMISNIEKSEKLKGINSLKNGQGDLEKGSAEAILHLLVQDRHSLEVEGSIENAEESKEEHPEKVDLEDGELGDEACTLSTQVANQEEECALSTKEDENKERIRSMERGHNRRSREEESEGRRSRAKEKDERIREKEREDERIKEKEKEDERIREKEREDKRIKEKEREDERIREKEREDERIKEKEREGKKINNKESKGGRIKKKERDGGGECALSTRMLNQESPTKKQKLNKIFPQVSEKSTIEELSCGFCEERFYDEPKMRQHVYDYHSTMLFHCEKCKSSPAGSRGFLTTSNILDHLKETHGVKGLPYKTIGNKDLVELPANFLHKIVCTLNNCATLSEFGSSGVWLGRDITEVKGRIIKHNLEVHQRPYVGDNIELRCRVSIGLCKSFRDVFKSDTVQEKWIRHCTSDHYGLLKLQSRCESKKIPIKNAKPKKPWGFKQIMQ